MFADFRSFDIPTSTPSVTIHGIQHGSGPPLLLLHGFPQNLLIWHLVAPKLTSNFTVIALDLRGYGQSSKPPGGEGHRNYGKSAMAQDCVDVMTHLGFEKFHICAHDRGGRVAHQLCVNHPERVEKAMLLDIAPTLAMYEKTNFNYARAYWHWYFLIQPSPLPESLMLGNPRSWIENTMGGRYGVGLDTFDQVAVESYVSQMSDEESVKGMCEDYRASASVDMEEQRKDIQEKRKIKCPLKVLWGKKGIIEAQFDALGEWRKVAEEGLVSGEAVDSGHYIPEEVPEILLRQIKEFFQS